MKDEIFKNKQNLKLKTLIVAMMGIFASHAYADDAAYTLSLKYINTDKQVEAVIIDRDGKQYLSVKDLTELFGKPLSVPTIKIDAEEYYPLESVGRLEINNTDLSAKLLLNPEFLPGQSFSFLSNGYNGKAKPQAGFHLDYDFMHDTAGKQTSLFINNGFSTASGSYGDVSFNVNSKTGTTLGDATYNIMDGSNQRLYTLGTGTTKATDATFGYRFAGIQIKSNHQLDRVRDDRPSNSFSGTAEVDGTAELYLNGSKILSQPIRPGAYNFDGLYNPMTTTGEAQLLIKDANGNIQTISRPLIGNPKNLKQGLSDYSLDFGVLRNDYNSFGKPFSTGSYSYGLTDKITVNGNYEATKDIKNFGTNALFATPIGTFKIGGSWGEGKAYSTGYYLNMDKFSFNAEYSKYLNYKNIADYIKNEDKLVITSRYALTSTQTLNLNYVRIGEQETTSLGTSFMVNKDLFLTANITKNQDKKYSAFVGVEFRFGGVSSSSSYDSRQNMFSQTVRQNTFELNKPEFSATYNNYGQSQVMQGRVAYASQYGDVSTTLYKSDTDTSATMKANGSLVFADGHIIPSRKINESYVVVDAKAPNININTNSGTKGISNQDGFMAYPSPSLAEQKFFIRTEDYDDETSPAETDFIATPFIKAPAKVEIKIKKTGFFLNVESKDNFIVIGKTQYFKTNQGFYIDDLTDGDYQFKTNNKIYKFNTKEIKDNKIDFN